LRKVKRIAAGMRSQTHVVAPTNRSFKVLLAVGMIVAVCSALAGAASGRAGGGASETAGGPALSGPKGVVREVRILESDSIGTTSPVGLAFAPRGKSFYVVPSSPPLAPSETTVVRLRPFALRPKTDRVGSTTIVASVRDPINIAYDESRNRLLLLRADGRRLFAMQTNPDGSLDRTTLVHYDVRRFGLGDSEGMAVDPATGDIFVLDGSGPRVVRLDPGPAGGFVDAGVSSIDLGASGTTKMRGIAFDPSSGHLQVQAGGRLYEMTTGGEIAAVRDLSAITLGTPQAMVVAPSGDQTDAPDQLSLYLADSGGSDQALGQIVELSLTAAEAPAASSFSSSLVHTVDTSAWDKPSPDPSGLAYLSGKNRIMVADGEVEETVSGITHFEGANVWETTFGGDVLRTANISKIQPTAVPMSNEPTGVAYDPAQDVYYFTDDGQKAVFRLSPGADDVVGTSDDSWNSFDVNVFGDGDPEGIAYDTAHNRVFVADGVNAEIYQYTTTGSLIGHFDVAAFGVQDPESVEYNPISGTLFVLSNRASGPIIVETSLTGTLIQTIDVAASGARKPAGLAYAPASDGSGALHFYIADRGVDNNSDPREVDGKIYELTTPQTGPNQSPTITSDGGGATASKSVPENQTAVTDVDASDPDNDPLTYSIAGGADASDFTINQTSGVLSFATPPDFEAPGDANSDNVYEVTVAVSDGRGGSDTQQISVTVTDVTEANFSPFTFSLRDAATVGGISVANEDIVSYDGAGHFSMVFDGSDVGLKGFRIDDFAWLDSDTLLFSVDADRTDILPGMTAPIDDSDVVRFDATTLGSTTAGTFSMYLDGSDVGFTQSAADVDTVELLSDGRIVISTTGNVSVSGISARDEDLLAFTPTTLGEATAGTFALYVDGSDVGLGDSGEDVDAASVDSSGKVFLSTQAAFAVPGVSGADEDVFVFNPTQLGPTTAGTYSPALFFDGSSFGLATNNVYGVDLP
jgi:sugar lactone lactonase YvrE